MNKKLIRLTESDLHRIVKESVNRILNEIGDTPKGQLALGAVAGRANVRGNRNTEIAASNKAWDNSASGKVRGRHYDSGYELGRDMEYDKQLKQHLASRLKESRFSKYKYANNPLFSKDEAESDLHRIVKESVNRILRESETDFQTYHHIRDNGTKVIVMANFIDYTFTFERKKLGEFDSIEEAKKFVLEIANNNEYIRDLADEVYSNMDENDETRIDNIILNIYKDYGDRGLYAIGNGISVIPKY